MIEDIKMIIENYYNNDNLLIRASQKILAYKEKTKIENIEVLKIEKFRTQNSNIPKVVVNYKLGMMSIKGKFTVDEEKLLEFLISHYVDTFKVYELVFADYDNLDFDQVIELIDGFRIFLEIRTEFTIEEKRQKLVYFKDILNLNENLPKPLKLWTMLGDD
jgi:hypothetical protein